MPQAKQRDRILIVCEDSVITPAYLKALAAQFKLGVNTDVFITGECGSSPKSVYECALKLLDEDIEKNGVSEAYDKIYCVIDKDVHEHYSSVRKKALENPCPKGKSLEIIASVPAFEYWVLLHYEFTTKHFASCADVVKQIRLLKDGNISGYNKKDKKYSIGLYEIISPNTQLAVKNSIFAEKAAADQGTDNPTTMIYKIIKEFEDQSKRV